MVKDQGPADGANIGSGRFFMDLLTRDDGHAKRNGTVDIACFKQGCQAGRVFGKWHGGFLSMGFRHSSM
jgi:hypothetical protein